ncbi:hemerythrin domain-containing protein [Kitasatospora sp. NPDC048540]|uniref:hemerythrin domain-containing protein n=1 Tax=Kitasatospora sp. NPDC048540 TaxID=3155634 RepID=UPI003407F1B9
MPTIDLYRNVHLGQRRRLLGLAVELGRADAARPGRVAALAGECLAMTRELREHADHEDAFIHPLLRERAPEAADALEAEHLRLDASLAALDRRARSLPQAGDPALPEAQHALYLALNELISAYLAHLHAEETVAMPALRDRCEESELAGVLRDFHASRAPEAAVADLRQMLPALPPAVRADIVRGLPAEGPGGGSMPAAVGAGLTREQYARLLEDLGIPESHAVRAAAGPGAPVHQNSGALGR